MKKRKKQESSVPDDASADMGLFFFRILRVSDQNFVDRNMLYHIFLKGKKKKQMKEPQHHWV